MGSLNMDEFIKVDQMPEKGETVLAVDHKRFCGGKGANQALAAQRLGAEVTMIGKVGADHNGMALTANLKKDGVNVDYIVKDKESLTGQAMITIDRDGNNSIIVIPGANMNFQVAEISKHRDVIEAAAILVAQLEVPLDVIEEAFAIAKAAGVLTILNTAPAKKISANMLHLTDILVANAIEMSTLTNIGANGLDNITKAGQLLIAQGVRYVIVTLGEKGAVLVAEENSCLMPGCKADTVLDTTGAGDAFIGAICSKLAAQKPSFEGLKNGIAFANMVAAMAVQREGAQASLPYLAELPATQK